MRKLLILPIVLILASTGCQSLRRVEVWKQQTFFAPRAVSQPMAPPAALALPAATPALSAPPAYVPSPGPAPVTVGSPVVDEPTDQEMILPGPAESISPGPVEDGPML